MDKIGIIEIRVIGKSGNNDLNQENYDTKHIATILQNVEDLLYPNNKRDRPLITAEFYFYGVLKDAGGKSKANIHIDTDDFDYLTIETGKKFLMEQEKNLLYKNFGVRANGKQNIETGEIDTKSLKLIELINYNPKFDNNYLTNLISKAKKSWQGVNTEYEYFNDTDKSA